MNQSANVNPPPKPGLFREEVIAARRAQADRADILAIDPTATSWGVRIIVVGAVLAVLFLCFGRVNEYASGPAIVRLNGRTALSAQQTGVVTKVLVVPGQDVEQGDVLLQLYAAAELAELEAAQRELDDQLRKLLSRPDDQAAREQLVSLRVRRDLAETRLAQRTVRAPKRGTIGDVRVREGQVVEPGASLAELHDAQSTAGVSALLPGRYRPYLAKGHKLRFRLDGFHRQVLELEVERVGDQIVGPREAGRYLGPDLADAFPVQGPVVMVEARLPRRNFDSDGVAYDYAHGMQGTAEAVVRNEAVVFALLPVLKPWDGESRIMAGFRSLGGGLVDSVKGLVNRVF
ncbi:MAG: HlyD family efflux transporter periplasmic adaptor subunit [Polyangiales bacterium]